MHINSRLDNNVLRDILLVSLADGIVGISYGALAHTQGFDFWVPLSLSIFVLTGASEFLFIGVVAMGGSAIYAALAGLMVNARHIPFSMAVKELPGKGIKSLLGFHILNDESVVFGLSQSTAEQNRLAFWACGLGILLMWPLGTMLGVYLGSFIVDIKMLGLDAMFPAIILALSLPALKNKLTRKAAIIGSVIALATTLFLPAGIPVLLSLLGVLFVVRKI
ncbi:TPA: AzlC family ABC transporter permease [Proteus mirabilis]|nr:AzlC family ABC transporter permease [Proteus mirabilis]